MSLNKKVFLKKTVYEASLDRIRRLFDEFPHVCVSVSGGKDSTVVFELTKIVAKEKNRLPLDVLFVDQESEWLSTIEEIKRIQADPDINLMWVQSHFKINNATSYTEDWMHIWDPATPDKWVREKDPSSYKEDLGDIEWYDIFHKLAQIQYGKEKACYIGGVRTEESPNRARSLTQSETHNGITWGKKLNANQFTFYPIYDWSYTDVWKAIHDNNWSYNKVYDKMYQYGIPVLDMRVSSLHHESSLRALFFLQEFEPDNYNRMVERLKGVHSAGKMSYDNFYCPETLPFMFQSWKEYRDYLIDNLVQNEKHRKSFRAKFESMEEDYHWVFGDRLYQMQINSVLTNDFGFWKLANLSVPRDKYDEFKRRKAERASRLRDAQSGSEAKVRAD